MPTQTVAQPETPRNTRWARRSKPPRPGRIHHEPDDRRCTCDDDPRPGQSGVRCLVCFWTALRILVRGPTFEDRP